MLAAIALGSNLPSPFGTPAETLRHAVVALGRLGRILKVSSFRQTAPVGYTDQPVFTNAALLLETAHDPYSLLEHLLQVECDAGRQRSNDIPPKGPRSLDLDLLLFEVDAGESLILQSPTLTLPHPEMHRRLFVLEPMTEIAPDMYHPVLQRSMRSLLAQQMEPSPLPATVAD